MFGYDTGVSNGAEISIQSQLGLDDIGLGVVISSLVFAAAVGGLVGGPVSDRIGRRSTILAMAVFFFCGTLLAVFLAELRGAACRAHRRRPGGGSRVDRRPRVPG
ncbi:MFS transporter [Sphingomonas sp. LR61]|uniref:MFS transporter n=1 Tax=Sphingomonas sp. LR61 TaxID=3050234 RepID=UPI002FE0D227